MQERSETKSDFDLNTSPFRLIQCTVKYVHDLFMICKKCNTFHVFTFFPSGLQEFVHGTQT